MLPEVLGAVLQLAAQPLLGALDSICIAVCKTAQDSVVISRVDLFWESVSLRARVKQGGPYAWSVVSPPLADVSWTTSCAVAPQVTGCALACLRCQGAAFRGVCTTVFAPLPTQFSARPNTLHMGIPQFYTWFCVWLPSKGSTPSTGGHLGPFPSLLSRKENR